MISELKPYPKYKDSELPWVGEIPEHWGLTPNRGLIRRRKVLVGERHKEYQLLSLTKQGVIVRDVASGKGKFSADMGTSQEVRKGDLIFCLFDVPETPRTIGLSNHDGMITGAYTVFEGIDQKIIPYFELFYLAMDDRKLLSPLYSGLRHTIPRERLLGTKTPMPPPNEQVAIVKFLNWANARIDRAIRAKRKVIALLNEQKQAIIHRALTRGIDPNVELKPTGVPWLGEIPRHWDIILTKRCSVVISKGTTPSTEGREITESGPVRFIKAENISAGIIKDSPAWFIDQHTDEILKRSKLKRDDILFVIAGATLGKIAIVKEQHLPANTNQAVAFIRPNNRVVPQYLALWLGSPLIKDQIWLNAVQSAQPNLSMGSLGKFPVPVPLKSEQSMILNYINDKTDPIEVALQRVDVEIGLLKEYRTRLVADVVTGKLDINSASSSLSIETEPVSPDFEDETEITEVES